MALVSVADVQANPEWLLFDCRHDLSNPEHGQSVYKAGHIPGAVHAHLDHDLAGDVGDGSHGRHPLPDPDSFLEFLRKNGVNDDSMVVCYDDVGGAYAARLWWLLRHYGHTQVAVLNGGLNAWKDAAELEKKKPRRKKGKFGGEPGHMPTVEALQIQMDLLVKKWQLVDARAEARYSGEVEPLDPVAGHIPGALNLPFADNLDDEGLFLESGKLANRFEGALGVQDAGRVAVYCGSGVTAAHDVLAMELAGMGTASLYPGSWSEWCQPDAERPTEP